MRPLAMPRPIRVRTDAHDRPEALWSHGRWTRIEAIRERWRIEDEWWRNPISRDYHIVVLEGGRWMTLYRDRRTGAWHRQH